MPLSSRPPKYFVTMGTLGALMALGPLSVDFYLPALPTIASDFGAPIESIQYSLTSFFIGLAAGQLFYGPLMDRFGRKRPLYLGLIIYGIASLACAITDHTETLIFMRLLQALGSCAGMVGSRAMVRDLFDQKDSAKVFSLLFLIMGIAPILAPLVGAFIAGHWGWPLIFIVQASFAVLCLLSVYLLLPETRAPNPEVRFRDSFSTFARIFRNPLFLGFVLSGAFVQSGMFAYIADSPYVFIQFFKIEPKHYSWVFGSNVLGMLLASQLNVQLLKHYSSQSILRGAFFTLCASSLCLALVSYFNLGFIFFIIPLFVYISTLGITFPNVSATALAQEDRRIGSASALMGTIQFCMAASSSGLVSYLHNGTTLPMAGTMAACGLISLIIFSFISRRDTQQNL